MKLPLRFKIRPVRPLLTFLSALGLLSAFPGISQTSPSSQDRYTALVRQHQSRIRFEENKGQWPEGAAFRLQTPQAQVQFFPDRASFGVLKKEASGKPREGFVWSLRWLGGRASTPRAPKSSPVETRRFYRGRSDFSVKTAEELAYDEVYPGIDLRFYSTKKSELEYDFIVQPGADPAHIRLTLDGMKRVSIAKNGELVMETPLGELRKGKPVAWQVIGGKEMPVMVNYALNEQGEILFKTGPHDPTQALVIDPISLQWSTFLGGAGFDRPAAVKVAPDGSVFVTGSTNSANFPTTPGAFQTTLTTINSNDAFVTKLNADGNTVLWSTYLGGSNNDEASDLELDPAGNVYVTGVTTSQSSEPVPFPTTPNAAQPTTASPSTSPTSLFLSKFDASGALQYSTFWGAQDTFIGGNPKLAVSITGEAYIAVPSLFGTGPGLLTTPGAYQASRYDEGDPYVLAFNADGTVKYATYFGSGSRGESLNEISLAPGGELYLAGYVNDRNPITLPRIPVTPGGYQTAPLTEPDYGYVALLNANGTAVLNSTHLRGIGPLDLERAADGSVYVLGLGANPATAGLSVTTGSIYPVSTLTNAQTSNLMALHLNGALSSLQQGSILSVQTQFGISGGENSGYLELDALGGVQVYADLRFVSNASVAPLMPGAFQPNPIGGSGSGGASATPYFTLLNSTLSQTSYATFLHGTVGYASATNLAVGPCKTYLLTVTSQSDFPVTPSAFKDDGVTVVSGYDASYNGSFQDAVLSVFNYPKVTNPAANTISTSTTSYCKGSAIRPLMGTAFDSLGFALPVVQFGPNSSTATAGVDYQWQQSSSAGGPWADIPGATGRHFTPVAPLSPTTIFYRRQVRIPAWAATCAPGGPYDSNVLSLTFSSDQAPTTDLLPGTYGFCNTSPLALSVNIASADGNFAPYTYAWTPPLGLTLPAGSVPGVSSPINTTINQPGTYYLQVTDSRGCVSDDTLDAAFFALDTGPTVMYTCGATTVKFGPGAPAPDYANFPFNTYQWSPATGLNNPGLLRPTLSPAPTSPNSAGPYTLTVNGCVVGSATVQGNPTLGFPHPLPPIALCQGDSAQLGQGVVAQPGITYQWAPVLGIRNAQDPNTVLKAAYAPQGVNVQTYYLTGYQPGTGCYDTTSQGVTIYRLPTEDFGETIPICYDETVGILPTTQFGTATEPGISYAWTATVTVGTGNVGVPTNGQALGFLNNPNAASVVFALPGPGIGFGGLANGTYAITYVRTSFNTANPTCARTDTVVIEYSVGPCTVGAGGCTLLANAGLQGSCGGDSTLVGTANPASFLVYHWSPVLGLKDPLTGLPLLPGGPHPAQVVANPANTTIYTLVVKNPNIPGDSCVSLVNVFAAAQSTPVVIIPPTASTCYGGSVQIGGPPIVGFDYHWQPFGLLNDSSLAQPTVQNLTVQTLFRVDVTEPISGCKTRDSVLVSVLNVSVNAGPDGTFCPAVGKIVSVGALPNNPNYTYAWSSNAAGVSLANPTAAQTTATIPPATPDSVYLILTVTDINTSCVRSDTALYRHSAGPTTGPNQTLTVCVGGTIQIGNTPPPGSSYTYLWTSADPGNGLTLAQSTQPRPLVAPTGTGPWTYTATVSESGPGGSCSATYTVTVTRSTEPVVLGTPPAPCAAGGVPIGLDYSATQPSDFSYSWSPGSFVVSGNPATDGQISVYPPVPTTYTLTAIGPGGCVLTYLFNVPAASYVASLGTNLSLCKNGSANPTLALQGTLPGGATVTWTGTNVALLSSTSGSSVQFNLAGAPVGSDTFTASVSYGAGCVSNASITVEVVGLRNFAGTNRQTCAGNCVQIGSLAAPGYSFQWTPVPYSAAAAAALQNPTASLTTVCLSSTTTYQLTATHLVTGCTFTDLVTVQVRPIPTLIVDDVTVCQNAAGNQTVSLPAALTQNTGVGLGYWLDATAQFAPVPNPGAVGQGIYYLKSFSADSLCFALDTVVVTVDELPDFNGTTAFDCVTGLGTLTLSGYAPGDEVAFVAGTSFPGAPTFGPVPAGGILSATLPGPGPSGQTYLIRVRAANGCFLEKIIPLTAFECPCPTAILGAPVCAPNGATYSVPFIATGTGITVTVSAGVIQGDSIVNIPAGTNLAITVQSAGEACESFFNILAPECDCEDPPLATLFLENKVKTDTVCAGSGPVSLQVTVGGNASLGVLSTTGQGTFSTATTGNGTATITYTPASADTLVRIVLATDNPLGGLCVAARDSVVLRIQALPGFSLSAIPATCTGPVPNPNGLLTVNGLTNGKRVAFAQGAVVSTPYASANDITGLTNVVPANTLPAVLVPTLYTVRVWASERCFSDQTVTLPPTICLCLPRLCVPVVTVKVPKR